MDRKIKKKTWTLRRIVAVAIGLFFMGSILFVLIWGDKSSKLNVKKERLTISTVSKGPFQEFIPVTGIILPIKTHYLDAVEGGKVEEIFLEAGSLVKKGDKILRLGNTNLLISISNQEARVVEQGNRVTNTKFNFEQNRIRIKRALIQQNYEVRRRMRKFKEVENLYKKNLIPKVEFEDAEDEYHYQKQLQDLNEKQYLRDSTFQTVQVTQLEASLKRLHQNLAIARSRLDELVIRAPITGMLTSLNAEIGESKSQGQRIGRIDMVDGFKIRAGIDEHYLPKIDRGQAGEFDFNGKRYRLVTRKIFPEIRNGRFEVDMEFEEKEAPGVRRGQTVHIRLELSGLSQQILLPQGAFYQKTGGRWIYIVDKSGDFAMKRSIRLGRKNTRFYEVLEGLSEGEKVITSSYENFGAYDKLILK